MKADAQGGFEYKDVAAGAWWIGPSSVRNETMPAKPEFVAPIAQVLEIAEGEVQRDVMIHTDRGLYIRGRVLAPSGGAPEYALVMAKQLDGDFTSSFNLNRHADFA